MSVCVYAETRRQNAVDSEAHLRVAGDACPRQETAPGVEPEAERRRRGRGGRDDRVVVPQRVEDRHDDAQRAVSFAQSTRQRP